MAGILTCVACATVLTLFKALLASVQTTASLPQTVFPALARYLIWPVCLGGLSVAFHFAGHAFRFSRSREAYGFSCLLPKEQVKIVERLIPLKCTCNIHNDQSNSPDDSGYSSPRIVPNEAHGSDQPATRNGSSHSNSGNVTRELDTCSRTLDECATLHKFGKTSELSNSETIELGLRGIIPIHSLEKNLGNPARAVRIRRAVVSRTVNTRQAAAVETSLLPFKDYDYARVQGACAENVIGYMPIPVGVAGPIRIDDNMVFIPMATTEGALIASTSRGAKAINMGSGVTTVVTGDGMTRGPVVRFPNIIRTAEAKNFIESAEGQQILHLAFGTTSSHARLQSVTVKPAGSYLYMRFKASTGEAMGMNMTSKGTERALDTLRKDHGFDDMKIVSLSGNYCADKKAAAINWIGGRGKSVVAQAVISAEIVLGLLKCSVPALIHLNTTKNLVGSALAGVSSGGFNAQAANVVTAIFLATGQDPAQNVSSSNCITMMEQTADGELEISVSMPSLEVGTVGGGTVLEPQKAMLDLMGCRGVNRDAEESSNASMLARFIAGGVMAGELSLCSALVKGELVTSHLAHNRKGPAQAKEK